MSNGPDWDEEAQMVGRVIFILLLYIFIILLAGGCSRQLLKQAPVLAKEERMWSFSPVKGVLKHRRCEKLEGKDRDCTTTYLNILEDWDMFYPGHIVIPKRRVFK